MRYFYDTEFLEDGNTIELISLGMVAEDGREFYAVSSDFRWSRIASRHWLTRRWTVHAPWLLENVVSSLPKLHGDARLHYGRNAPGCLGILDHRDPRFMSRHAIRDGVRALLHDDPDPQLWAYYAAYDHVALCQLWGRMMQLPDGVPMWTHDLMQECERQGNPRMPEQPSGDHNALADARWLKHRYEWLQQLNLDYSDGPAVS